jgi:hypothetical protein
MKNLNFLLFLLIQLACCSTVYGQTPIELKDITLRNGAEIKTIKHQHGHDLQAIRLVGNQSELQFVFTDVDAIAFRHSLPKINENCFLVLEIKSEENLCENNNGFNFNNDKWIELKKIDILSEGTGRIEIVLTESILPRLSKIGKNTIRLRIDDSKNSSNGVYIDSIVVSKIDATEKERIRDQIIIGCALSRIKSSNCDSIISQYSNIEKLYLEYFSRLLMMQRDANWIDLLGKLSSYMTSRSQMGNPIAYKEFNNLLDSISMAPGIDNNGKLLLQDYRNQLSKVDTTAKKIFNIGRPTEPNYILQTIQSVASLITGGRIDNVINNVKQIISNVYSRSTLSSIYQPFDLTLNKGRIERDENIANSQRIEEEIKRGEKYMQNLIMFANITREENDMFLRDANKILNITSSAEQLSNDISSFISDYLEEVNIRSATDSLSGDRTSIEIAIKGRISNHFGKMIQACKNENTNTTCQEHLIILERLKDHMEMAQILQKRYIQITSDLIEVYSTSYNEMESRKNPFSGHQPSASEKYDQYKKQSLSSLSAVISILNKLF